MDALHNAFGPADYDVFPIAGRGINWRRLRAFPKPSLLSVGDDDQAIYGFRGSDSKTLKLIEQRFPDTFVSFLTLSHRCQPNILDATNALVSGNTARYDKSLKAPESKKRGSPVVITRKSSSTAEIDDIVNAVKNDIADGKPLSNTAVLTRTRNLARDVSKYLRSEGLPVSEGRSSDLRNAAEVKDVMAFVSVLLNDSAEVHLRRIVNKPARGMGSTSMSSVIRNAKIKEISLFDELRSIMNDRIEVPEGGQAYKPAFVRSTKDFGKMIVTARQMMNDAETAGDALDALLTLTGYKQDLYEDALKANGLSAKDVPQTCRDPRQFLSWIVDFSARSKNHRDQKTSLLDVEHDELLERGQASSKAAGAIANIAVLIEQARSHSTLQDFLEAATLDMSHEETREGIVVMTMHAAKGLEFDRVFLPFWMEGVMPHSNALNDDDHDLSGGSLEEERRLAYVSMTRARHDCVISFGPPDTSAFPALYGVRETRESRFITEIRKKAPDVIQEDAPRRQVSNSTKPGQMTSLLHLAVAHSNQDTPNDRSLSAEEDTPSCS